MWGQWGPWPGFVTNQGLKKHSRDRVKFKTNSRLIFKVSFKKCFPLLYFTWCLISTDSKQFSKVVYSVLRCIFVYISHDCINIPWIICILHTAHLTMILCVLVLVKARRYRIQGGGDRLFVHFAVTFLDCWRTSFCLTTITNAFDLM